MRGPGMVVLATLALAAAGQGAGPRPAGFPHAAHTGLFPAGCAQCHGGDEATPAPGVFPPPETCQRCHDGQRLRTVDWESRQMEPSMVVFQHQRHAEASALGGDPPACAACHGGTGGGSAMAVAAAAPGRCLACHAAGTEAGHLALEGAACARCHRPLASNPALPAARVAALPRPPGHGGSPWLANHGAATDASCAVCHARESCERCHLNGGDVGAIRDLAPDVRVALLVASLEPTYFRPPGHADGAWRWEHGAAAGAAAATCANCHARESCTSCHGGGRTPAVAALPGAGPGDARGVRQAARATAVHGFDFVRGHSVEAAAATARCSACHAAATCTACHAGATAPAFHDDNFVARHGSEAFAVDSRCASCHSTEVFCRACHASAGIRGGRASGAVFHDQEGFWLIGHGQAARQGLEACATCHSQSSCAACHSVTGWGVSPHGPRFDARRAEAANPLVCRRCHLGAS